jgi:hypothetical protein
VLVAIYILCACFIDHLSQLRYYQQIPEDKKGAKGLRYRQFVKEYMGGNKYKPQKLYDSLRSRLIHDYSTDGKYFLDWQNKKPHLKAFKDSENKKRIMLQLGDFITDLESAFKDFYKDLLIVSSDARISALAHEKRYKIFSEYNSEIEQEWL